MNLRSFDEIWDEPVLARDDALAEEAFESFELRMLKALLDAVPNDANVLFQLGAALTKAGDHERALEVDRKLVNIRQEDPISHYNLACSYSNLGKKDQALDALEEAFKLGYWDLEHMEQDPDLDNIKDDPRYHELVEDHFEMDPDMNDLI